MTTKVEHAKEETGRRMLEEADMKARFLVADIQAALDRVPDDALPEVNKHLEQALKSARDAMETKKREETTKRLK